MIGFIFALIQLSACLVFAIAGFVILLMIRLAIRLTWFAIGKTAKSVVLDYRTGDAHGRRTHYRSER